MIPIISIICKLVPDYKVDIPDLSCCLVKFKLGHGCIHALVYSYIILYLRQQGLLKSEQVSENLYWNVLNITSMMAVSRYKYLQQIAPLGLFKSSKQLFSGWDEGRMKVSKGGGVVPLLNSYFKMFISH